MHLLVVIYLTLITVCGESSWKPTTNPPHSPATTQTIAEIGERKSDSNVKTSSETSSSFTSSRVSTLSSTASIPSDKSTMASTINKEATVKATLLPPTSKPESTKSSSPSSVKEDMGPSHKDAKPSHKDAKLSQEDAGQLEKDIQTKMDNKDQKNRVKPESTRSDETKSRSEISSTRAPEEPNIKLWNPDTGTNTRGNEMSSSSTLLPTSSKRKGIAMSRRTISMSEDGADDGNDDHNKDDNDNDDQKNDNNDDDDGIADHKKDDNNDKNNNNDDDTNDNDDDDEKDDSKTRLDTSEKEEKGFFMTTQASKLTTKDSKHSVLTGASTPSEDQNTKQMTKMKSDSSSLPSKTRPFKGQQESTEDKLRTTKSTQTVSVTSQTPVKILSTSSATTRQILTRSKKKSKLKRIRKRKKKGMVNPGQPKIQIHSIDVPQPMPMLLSPKGRPEVKKKKRANKKVANRVQGARGPKGEKGDRGEKGERGLPGPPANVTEDLPEVKLQAAATAVLTDHFGPDKNVIVPFDLKLIDLADNYDNSSGVFMTSIPGIYVISLYLMSHPGAKVNARIFINNRPVAALWADDSKNAGFYPSSSIQTISKLAFGDQVYVMLVDGGYGESWVHANYNAFSLYLLYEETFF